MDKQISKILKVEEELRRLETSAEQKAKKITDDAPQEALKEAQKILVASRKKQDKKRDALLAAAKKDVEKILKEGQKTQKAWLTKAKKQSASVQKKILQGLSYGDNKNA